MRFDDTFETVLATDRGNPAAAQAAWRQIVDLVGRGRVEADVRAMKVLEELYPLVSLNVRAASAQALSGARPAPALVALLARDDIAVAGPILRTADLDGRSWQMIVPTLSPTARAVLRHRRGLPVEAVRALESFGPTDFVLGPGDTAGVVGENIPAAGSATVMAVETGPFVSVGRIAREIVDHSRHHENGDAPPPPVARADGTFRIADVVARIEAFRRRRDGAPFAVADAPRQVHNGFRFESDADGVLRWIEGGSRAALIGIALARPAVPGNAGVDGVVAGAYRKRAAFDRARLVVAGQGASSGDWTISGAPLFDSHSGRFVGYRGSARRPRSDERAEGLPADALRELVHELRTPTSAIAGFSEMIEQEVLGPVAAPHRAHASAIRAEAGQLLAAIEDIDTAARIRSGSLSLRKEPVAVAPILVRVADRLAALAKDRGAVLRIDGGDASVVADAVALERLLNRLIATMLAAAAAGEAIAVRIRADDGGTTRIAVDRPAALAHHAGKQVLEIEDEAGPASLLGAGFSLRLVRNLALEMGGGMKFGDRRLTLRLPAALDHPVERARQKQS